MFRIRKHGKKTPKKGKTLMDHLKDSTPPIPDPVRQEKTSISPEDAALVKFFLDSPVGRELLRTLGPIARRDLHPKNLNISYDAELKAVDICVVFIDTNTPIWHNLSLFMWRNRMTWRFDGTGLQLTLIVRWFLPYQLPMDDLVDPSKIQVGIDPGKEMPTHAVEEEVGQTKQSTIEESLEEQVKAMAEESLDERQKEMADGK